MVFGPPDIYRCCCCDRTTASLRL